MRPAICLLGAVQLLAGGVGGLVVGAACTAADIGAPPAFVLAGVVGVFFAMVAGAAFIERWGMP